MAMKDWLQRLQPLQIYLVLTLSIVYFLVQLFLSHITHALTLLVASYHMLCNIIALTGCIITIKVRTVSVLSINSSKFTPRLILVAEKRMFIGCVIGGTASEEAGVERRFHGNL